MMQKDRYIAFVCTGNTCRSPMAEGIFNKIAEEKGLGVRAVSFGLAAVKGMPPSEKAVKACSEIGIDISGKRSNFIYDFDIAEFEKIYCMSDEHFQILTQSIGLPAEKVEVLDIQDPYGSSLEVYKMCRDMIYTAVEEIVRSYET